MSSADDVFWTVVYEDDLTVEVYGSMYAAGYEYYGEASVSYYGSDSAA